MIYEINLTLLKFKTFSWIFHNPHTQGTSKMFVGVQEGYNHKQRQRHTERQTHIHAGKTERDKYNEVGSCVSGLAIIVLMAPHLFQSRPAPPAVSLLNLSPKCYNYKYNHKHKYKYSYKYKYTGTHPYKCLINNKYVSNCR